jgi:putative Mg2+ transporter-C (MgtC) family protein
MGKPAGVRTNVLVCLGAAIFVHLGSAAPGTGADPTRVLGQLATAGGFLGAGVMFFRKDVGPGVTTAALIWLITGVGGAIGLGFYEGAVALSAVTVALLVGIDFLESGVKWLTRGVHGGLED